MCDGVRLVMSGSTMAIVSSNMDKGGAQGAWLQPEEEL